MTVNCIFCGNRGGRNSDWIGCSFCEEHWAHIKCALGTFLTPRVWKKKCMINEELFDILAIAETWLGEVDTAKIIEITSVTHIFVSAPRTD